MLVIFVLDWIVDSNWFQKLCQCETLTSNPLITNFGNLQMTPSILFRKVEKLFEIKGASLLSFLFEASSIDAIN